MTRKARLGKKKSATHEDLLLAVALALVEVLLRASRKARRAVEEGCSDVLTVRLPDLARLRLLRRVLDLQLALALQLLHLLLRLVPLQVPLLLLPLPHRRLVLLSRLPISLLLLLLSFELRCCLIAYLLQLALVLPLPLLLVQLRSRTLCRRALFTLRLSSCSCEFPLPPLLLFPCSLLKLLRLVLLKLLRHCLGLWFRLWRYLRLWFNRLCQHNHRRRKRRLPSGRQTQSFCGWCSGRRLQLRCQYELDRLPQFGDVDALCQNRTVDPVLLAQPEAERIQARNCADHGEQPLGDSLVGYLQTSVLRIVWRADDVEADCVQRPQCGPAALLLQNQLQPVQQHTELDVGGRHLCGPQVVEMEAASAAQALLPLLSDNGQCSALRLGRIHLALLVFLPAHSGLLLLRDERGISRRPGLTRSVLLLLLSHGIVFANAGFVGRRPACSAEPGAAARRAVHGPRARSFLCFLPLPIVRLPVCLHDPGAAVCTRRGHVMDAGRLGRLRGRRARRWCVAPALGRRLLHTSPLSSRKQGAG